MNGALEPMTLDYSKAASRVELAQRSVCASRPKYTASASSATPLATSAIRRHRSIRASHAPTVPANNPSSRNGAPRPTARSEEHTSELQSLTNLVCRLLLEKKKTPALQRHQPTVRDNHNTTSHTLTSTTQVP